MAALQALEGPMGVWKADNQKSYGFLAFVLFERFIAPSFDVVGGRIEAL